MKRALALVAMLPFAAVHADLIGVDYEGTITEVGEGPIFGGGRTFDYAVGDPIAGRLFIDTALASSSGADGDFESRYTGFVRGVFPVFGLPDEEFDPESGDAVSIRSGASDFFSVEDVFIQANTRVGFTLSASADHFLHGTGIEQSFELTSGDLDEHGESLIGSIWDVNAGWTSIFFALRRLTVKPARCFAPG